MAQKLCRGRSRKKDLTKANSSSLAPSQGTHNVGSLNGQIVYQCQVFTAGEAPGEITVAGEEGQTEEGEI